MDPQVDADITPRPSRRTESRILDEGGVSRLSFTSPGPLFSANSSFAASSSITINPFVNADSSILDPGMDGDARFDIRSAVEFSTSAPVSRSPSPRKRRHNSSQFGTDKSRKSSRSNSRHSSVSSKSVASDASTEVRRIEFPKSVKENVKKFYGKRCWLCEHPHRKLNIAHIIPRADTEFEDYVLKGLLPFSELHDIDNAIPLCLTCHDPFDAKPPGFIILPVDLAWFLDFERADFSDRQMLLQNGKNRRRIVPTSRMYRAHLERKGKLADFPSAGAKGANKTVSNECEDQGGLYDVYIRTDHLTNTWDEKKLIGLFLNGKIWHGSPTALILHAARVISYPNCGEPWVDDEKLRLIFDLILLWGKEPTVSHQTDENSESVSSSHPSSSRSDDQDSQGKDETSRGPPSFHGDSRSASAASETVVNSEVDDPGYDTRIFDFPVSVAEKIESNWQWGPTMTSADIVRFYCNAGI